MQSTELAGIVACEYTRHNYNATNFIQPRTHHRRTLPYFPYQGLKNTMDTNAKSGDLSNDSARKAYILPNNRQEIERMKNQHEWIKAAFGGLIKVPIDYQKKNQRILDSAAADGITIHLGIIALLYSYFFRYMVMRRQHIIPARDRASGI